jgi:cell division protein FtsB
MTTTNKPNEQLSEDELNSEFVTQVLVEVTRCCNDVVSGYSFEARPLLRLIANALQAQREELEKTEKALDEELKNRDYYEEMADKLAFKIATILRPGEDWIDVIGEHSSMNNPWERALELESLTKEGQA